KLLILLSTTAALSACGGNKKDVSSDASIEPAPSVTESIPPAADIIPPGAVPDESTPEGAVGTLKEKAEDMKDGAVEGANDTIDAAKEKAKEAVTN
ncbi:MAG: hypothetical protein V3U64_03545, partial [Cocleimonas sp.]